MDKELRPGNWVWDIEHREPAKVAEVVNLWGHNFFKVWIPSKDAYINLRKDSIKPIEQSDFINPHRLSYVVSSLRIYNERSMNRVLSPVESNVLTLPHQIYALQRAISNNRIRYLLADEVGLGKTIEAGLILKELKLRGLIKRTLIVAPKGLIPQWKVEMEERFGETFRVLQSDDINNTLDGANIWKLYDQIICPVDTIKPLDTRRGMSKEEIEKYNKKRLEDLVSAGWDVIIIDEAHRLGGSTEDVARYKLGKALSEASPYLLLLTATPHQGKTESFFRLMALLDKTAFPYPESISKDRVAPFVIRTEKRKAIDSKGNPLFKDRYTKLLPIEWTSSHIEEKYLYEIVTDYVRNGYNKAINEKRTYIGFLMVLMQRLVSSSTAAITYAMEKRLATISDDLNCISKERESLPEDAWECDGQEQLNEAMDIGSLALQDEKNIVEQILKQARKCQSKGPDAKAEELIDLMYKLQNEQKNPKLKFLVFTEFIPTQNMLKEFFENRGFSVACLNGSMDINHRRNAQLEFSEDKQILISTDAGGEGLNLQFCNIIINYDLPWNPMKIEQRIGRVDRIGQKKDVKAYNMQLKNSVEFRVHEILQEKLTVILNEFGVDKASDVLDTLDIDINFNDLFMQSLMNPEESNSKTEEVLEEIKSQIEESQKKKELLNQEEKFDLNIINKIQNHPMPLWIEKMVISYLKLVGGKINPLVNGYDLIWPDGEKMEKVTFHKNEAIENDHTALTLDNPKVQRLVKKQFVVGPGQPIINIIIPSISKKITGYWSLWHISIQNEDNIKSKIIPIFLHDDGRIFQPTANKLWDIFTEGNNEFTCTGIGDDKDFKVYNRLLDLIREFGHDTYNGLIVEYKHEINQEKEKFLYFFKMRKEAISKIGLENVKQKRLKDLEIEFNNWSHIISKKEAILPCISPMIILRVEGRNEMD